ncbi:MAG: response regulator [Eubacteriales bacterium]|nr:response regulator [Eubacteriales bacterium]
MIKVLVVEDEASICALIINLINWIPDELELVGTASNGVEGYASIVELKPDLVITDIRMPGLSGLELIEKVKQNNLDPMFIIISGHKEFDYARNAIKFGVEDYLLKPIKRDELNNTLKKIIAKHQDILNQVNHQSDINSKLAQSIQVIRRDRLFRYFYHPDVSVAHKESVLLEGNDFNFQEGKFRTLLVSTDDIDDSFLAENKSNVALETLCDGIQTCLEKQTFVCEYALDGSIAAFLINYSSDLHVITEVRAELIEKIINQEYKYECFKFCMAVGEETDSLQKLERSTLSANFALKHRLDNKDVTLINAEDFPSSEIKTEYQLPEKDKSEFIRFVTTLNASGINLFVNAFVQNLLNSEKTAYLLYDVCDAFIDLTRQSIIASGLDQSNDNALPATLIKQKLRNTRSSKKLLEFTLQFIENQIKEIFDSKEQQEIQPIKFTKQYMNEHFNEPITLEHIARELFLNPVYLGALIKNKTGTSFTNWLLSIRIEKAKELLKTTRFSIYEVAEMVGYSDSKHFSKLFLKHEGIKPIEYRKLYS